MTSAGPMSLRAAHWVQSVTVPPATMLASRSASGGECGSTMSAARPGTASQAASAASHKETVTPLASAVAATVRAWPQRSGSSLPAVTLMTRLRAVMLAP